MWKQMMVLKLESTWSNKLYETTSSLPKSFNYWAGNDSEDRNLLKQVFSKSCRYFKNTFHFWTSTFGTEIVILWKNSHTPPNCCHCRKVSKGSCTHNTHMCREHSQYFPFLKLVFPYLQLWISISSHNSQFHNMEWFLFCFLSGDIWRLVWVLLSVSAGSICQLKTIQYLQYF